MIKFLVTGGTIDGLGYYSPQRNDEKRHKSLIPSMLAKGLIAKRSYNVEVLMQKDGRFITDKDRELILQKCRKTRENQIVITHGTTTMMHTARYLGKRNLAKTIVLVGSLVFGNKKTSDAVFNLGMAVSAVQLLPKGVYIAMNGWLLSWDNVRHLSTGRFEAVRT